MKVDCWLKLHVSQWPCSVIMLVTSEIYCLLKCKMFIHFYLNELSFLAVVIDYARQKRDHFISIKFCMLSNVIISSIYRHKANDMSRTSRKFFCDEVEIYLNWYKMQTVKSICLKIICTLQRTGKFAITDLIP